MCDGAGANARDRSWPELPWCCRSAGRGLAPSARSTQEMRPVLQLFLEALVAALAAAVAKLLVDLALQGVRRVLPI